MKKDLINSWLFPRYIGIVYIEPVLRELRPQVQGIMVDIGCGTRRYENIFKENVDIYIGLDWPKIEERAFPDVIGDAMNIPFGNCSVDVVLATELMEHLPSPSAFLIEVARVLRERGVLILTVPFMEPLHEEPRDYYRFTPYSLNLLLDKYGFTIRKSWKKGGWWSVVLGSFINQSLYDWATSLDEHGHRHYGIFAIIVLPICALCQWMAYNLDKVFHSRRYTLGYTILAVREHKINV